MHLIIPLSPGYSPQYVADEYSKPSAKRGEKINHTVRKGESLYRIARRYRTSVGSIAQWNNINPSTTIYPGKKLTIYAYTTVKNKALPTTNKANGSKFVYNVKQGDSLYEIATRYKTTVRNLKRWNNLRSNRIHPGDQLTLYLADSNND
jgi:membrane-bound lytic murein transglycosylase D